MEPFTKGQAWVDLLLLANHSEGFISPRGVVVVVHRGQVGMSELQLSIRWKWSRTKTKKYLDLLEKECQIKQHRDNVSLLLTIVNYDMYQSKEHQKEQQKDTRKTPEEQQKDTNNNGNNKNNKNKPTTEFERERLDFFEQAWNIYPRKIGKPSALRFYLKTVKTDADINRINGALGNYLDSTKDTDSKFIKHGSTWFNNWQDWEVTNAE